MRAFYRSHYIVPRMIMCVLNLCPVCIVFRVFLGFAQKLLGGHACAARKFINLCVVLASANLNRLAGMNIRQTVRQFSRSLVDFVVVGVKGHCNS